jgi:SAM-dependent methyltransferase
MDNFTVQRLNAINREFYRITAADFDETRQQAWPGWEQLLPYLDTIAGTFSVLDVGCGNGRFGVFLAEHLRSLRATGQSPLPILQYHGIDNNAALLSRARETLTALPNIDVTLEERDLIETPPDAGSFDLVALFGVLHHIPSYARRAALLKSLAQRVKAGGLLAFACWRFYEEPRWRERIAPWPNDFGKNVETGDYLLDWRRGATALRYCHYVDDAEQDALAAATGLTEIVRYRADGANGQSNAYSVLQKPAVT